MAARQSVKHFDEQWPAIRKCLEQVYFKGPTKLDFMRLCGLVHHFRMFQMIEEGLTCKLTDFLKYIVISLHERLENLEGEDLLLYYVKYWKKYESLTTILRVTFSYSRNLPHHKNAFQNASSLELPPVDVVNISFTCWAELLLDPLAPKLSNAVLLFTKTVGNSVTDRTAVYHFICSLSDYGTTCHIHDCCKHAEHCWYKTIIEIPLLRNAEEFFETQSALMVNCAFIDMLKKIEDLYLKIGDQTYLHTTTQNALVSCFEAIVIKNAYNLILQEFRTSLLNHQIKNLRQVYEFLQLFHFLPTCIRLLNVLKHEFESHVYQQGLKAVTNNGKKIGSVAYIGNVLNIYSTYYNLGRSICEGSDFESVLDVACEKFINDQPCNSDVSSRISPADMLVKYCHNLLVKEPTEISEKECLEKISEALKIVKFIHKKDVFIALYSKRLVIRFLRKMCSSQINREENVVSKIADVCNFEVAVKLKKMLSDICLSRDLNKEFKRCVSASEELKFFTFVINSQSWPFNNPLSSENILLPYALQQGSKSFAHFYVSKFKVRKLKYLPLFAVGELASYCFDNSYVFEASALQIVILLQFNTKDTFSLTELQENTGLDQDSVSKILMNLLKVKLLVSTDEVLNPSSFVSLQLAYHNCEQKISIIPNKPEEKVDVHTYNHSTQNRKVLIEAAIIRIMKKNKTMKFHDLFFKIIDELSKQFIPDMGLVKSCIQFLTEAEYLKRENKNCYSYIAN